MSDQSTVEIDRTADEIEEKIEDLRSFDDYPPRKRGSDKRKEHAGWIRALRWALGSDLVEEP